MGEPIKLELRSTKVSDVDCMTAPRTDSMDSRPVQLRLPFDAAQIPECSRSIYQNRYSEVEQDVYLNGQEFHNWYRFVLAYSPDLVRKYIESFGLSGESMVLDPFCGTGTTLVECKLRGILSIGLETNPVARFASSVKVDWKMDPDSLERQARNIACVAESELYSHGIDDNRIFDGNLEDIPLKGLDPATAKLLLTNSISPIPLHKTLVLLEALRCHRNEPYYRYGLLALAKALVSPISNLAFGPEVGVGRIKTDVPVIASWLREIEVICADLRTATGYPEVETNVLEEDARKVSEVLTSESIDAVITSPPYPNEKDYTRTTRLESIVLGFVGSNADLRTIKQSLIRSNTRGVYKTDDDDLWAAGYPEVQLIARLIEQRRLDLGKTSGFEKLYGRVTRLYFGGMARHLAHLRAVLRPGAQLAYVVGDQASYLGVMIRTGQLLSAIAQTLGYELVSADLFRTRRATVTNQQLREEVVVLKWPGRVER
jgi:hypothetical protein